MSLFPADWKPWPKNRKRYRWRWGDPTGELFQADKDYGSYCHSEQLTILHPHLRRPKYHELLYQTKAHELLHAVFPNMSHARIYRLERELGYLIHDMHPCKLCAPRPRKSRYSR